MPQNLTTFLPLILLIALMYFLMIRPQRKREREVTTMRSGVKVGDEVVTIGGICGKVVKTKNDVLTIQVGADKVKFDVMRWAISKVVNAAPDKKAKIDEPAAEEPEESAPRKALPKRMKQRSDDAGAENDDAEPSASEDEGAWKAEAEAETEPEAEEETRS